MQVTYSTLKTYPNGVQELRLKNGVKSDNLQESIQKSLLTKKLNKERRKREYQNIIDEYNSINSLITDSKIERKKRILEGKLHSRNLDNVRRSVYRARQEVEDIAKCNDFKWFITLTFDKSKINRKNDEATRCAWSRFAFYLHKNFPYLYYLCVPEYHDKGGLHFHLLVGGVTAAELGLQHAVYSKGEKAGQLMYVTKGKNIGVPIYNVGAWSLGWSTATEIQNVDAAKHYVAKYITKQACDDRFFNKKRYYVSRNIVRPIVEKDCVDRRQVCRWDIDVFKWRIQYISTQKQFGVFKYTPVLPKQAHCFGFSADYAAAKPKNARIGSVRERYMQETMRKSLLRELCDPFYDAKMSRTFGTDLYIKRSREYLDEIGLL